MFEHRYWSIVENKRVGGGRVVQRHVLYLGEINSSQELAWRKSIEVFQEGQTQPTTLALFPEDRCEAVAADESVVQVRLNELRLEQPRHWGACWLVLQLWRELGLDEFWGERLLRSRKGTRWDQVLLVLVAYRLMAPGRKPSGGRCCFLRVMTVTNRPTRLLCSISTKRPTRFQFRGPLRSERSDDPGESNLSSFL